jgi:hypothetical protein
MATRQQQSSERPVQMALADGASTPNPGTTNAVLYSTTTNSWMRWTGSAWICVVATNYASMTKFGVD